MTERILITGGSGFVAFHIIEEAVRQGYEVHATIRKSSKVEHLRHLPIQYVYMDFTDVDAILTQLEDGRYQYIIHSAGTTAALNQQQYDLVNADYTYNLGLAVSRLQQPIKKLIFISSLASIGPSINGAEILEANTPRPVTSYGRSKLKAEQMLATIPGLPLITFRPTAVYGPRDKDVFIIIKTFAKGFEPYIGSKPQTLSFVYVKDLAKLVVNSLQSDIINKSYNISDGKRYGRYDMAGITGKLLNKKTFRLHLPTGVVRTLAFLLERSGRITGKTPALNPEKMAELTASWVCDAKAAQHDLGYTPAYDLKAGLEESLEWYKKEKWL